MTFAEFTRQSRDTMALVLRERAARPLARAISAIVEPLYYWLDLFGRDGRPSNGKVLWTLVVFSLVYVTTWKGVELTEITTGYLWLVGITLLAAGGSDLVKKIATMIAGHFAAKLPGQAAPPPPPEAAP